jgi:hypothetical protein
MISSPSHFARPRGAAIVIVLLFVVLLTVLALAFFMKATAFRGLSQSAVSEFKADTLARSALALTVGDLRQEIANGSSVRTVGPVSLYVPSSPLNAVPQRSGNPALNADGTDPTPNLIRRSVRADAIASPGVSSRASAASSAAPSRNGRFIDAARWNKHYLLPRDPALYGGANSSKVGTQPVPAFVPPDWVYVTDKGPEELTSSKRSVIGRYAFAMYDEGGLLDVNAAGYASNTPVETRPHPNPNPHDRPGWGSGHKSTLAQADLTVLGLTQNEVDQIVGWRNFATARPSGQFPSFTFEADAALRAHEHSLSNETGFLTAADTTWTVGGQDRTDQIFTSRQQLLKFRNQVGFSQDALQYLGTFSRSLEQPSYIPDPARPKVVANQNTNNASFGRGNDAYNLDRNVAAPAKDINPPLPEVRVKTAFTRPDGTEAAVGDPLMKHRFPLSRLKKILKTATASKNESDPIYREFGIYRSSASSPWEYDHGNSSGILRLDEVAALGREPDFFEVLKAGLEIGSLGKPAAFTNYNVAGSFVNIIFQQAALTALHTLQIGANIIDQADEDGFPTRIAFAGDPSRVVSGIEDLPYIYQLRNRPSFPTELVGRWLVQPVLWNPHDPAGKDPASAPVSFRIRAVPQDPAQKASFVVSYLQKKPPAPDPVPPNPTMAFELEWDLPTSPFGAMTFNAGESHGYHDFRQPTLLGEAGIPAGSAAHGNDFNQENLDADTTLVGIVAAEFLMKIPSTSIPGDFAYANKINFSGPTPGVNFILEYQDGANWVPYNMFPYWSEGSGYGLGFTSTLTDAAQKTYLENHFTNGGGLKAIDYQSNGDERWRGLTRTDPREVRKNPTFSQYIHKPAVLNPAQNTYETYRGGTGVSFGDHHMGVSSSDNGFKGGFANNTPNWHRGFQHGYWAENSARETRQQPLNSADPETRRFNRDPDGIVRRAMGGYATDPASGGDFNNLHGLPLATNNFASRPLILNRPFQSVAELGHVYRGEAWKNLSFGFPESGDRALLDLFCVEEPATPEGVVAGKVNLNTRQATVLKALLTGAIVDETDSSQVYGAAEAEQLAGALIKRTTGTNVSAGEGPLINTADLVGRWKGPALNPTDVDPETYFAGFSSDIGALPAITGTPKALIPRQREAAIRVLASNGNVRTWNFLIDLVAQSGRFASDNESLDKFVVEGEKRYWLHVAIDRLTGEVVDTQWEMVTE